MPSVVEWEAYKTASHGEVVRRSHCILDNLLIIHCADGTAHNRSLSRKDRGEVDPYGWHDDGYPPMVGHGLGTRG